LVLVVDRVISARQVRRRTRATLFPYTTLFRSRDDAVGVADLDGEPQPVATAAQRRLDVERAVDEARRHPDPLDALGGDRLEPDRLPDAGGARVVAVGVGVGDRLLAAGLRAARLVARAHHDRHVLARADDAGQVRGERRE